MGHTVKVITDAATEPISVEEFRQHSRIDASDYDTISTIERFIGAVRRLLEARTGRIFHEQTLEMYLDSWPSSRYIELPGATPLIAISAVGYKDTDGVETTTWAAYIADTRKEPGRLVLGYGESWPSEALYPASPIRIRYRAGIAEASPITEAPDDAKAAMLFLCGSLWEHREDLIVSEHTNIDVKTLGIFERLATKLQVTWPF